MHLCWLPHSALLRQGLSACCVAPAQACVQGIGGSSCRSGNTDSSSRNGRRGCGSGNTISSRRCGGRVAPRGSCSIIVSNGYRSSGWGSSSGDIIRSNESGCLRLTVTLKTQFHGNGGPPGVVLQSMAGVGASAQASCLMQQADSSTRAVVVCRHRG